MPVPSLITDLSATPASNSPPGTEAIGTSLDDYLRTIFAFIRQVYDSIAGKLNLAGGTLTGPLVGTTATFTKVLGDTNNGTLANRLTIQDSTTNASSFPQILPNGTGTAAAINFAGNSAFTNIHYGGIGIDGTAIFIQSAQVGSGITKPFEMRLGGATTFKVALDGTTMVGVQASGSFTQVLPGGIEIGNIAGTPTNVVLDMHSSGNNTDYDVRLLASGGNGSAGNGNLGITATAVTVSGAFNAASLNATSDSRLKSEVLDISDEQAIRFLSIQPRTYDKDGRREAGFYAQDVRQVAPELVSERDDGMLLLDAGNGIAAYQQAALRAIAKRVGL